MNDDRWHQKISVALRPRSALPLTRLRTALLAEGFKPESDGELFRVERTDVIEPWQTETLIGASLWNGQTEVYFDSEEAVTWTHLECYYLLPWLPFENAEVFVRTVFRLAERIDAAPEFGGKPATAGAVSVVLDECAKDLEARLEAPGGSFLAQAIEQRLRI